MDEAWFSKYFLAEDTSLRAYFLAVTCDYHESEELLQRTWITLWSKHGQFDVSRPFRAWAFGVARLEVLKWRQRKARSREVLSEKTIALLADTAEIESSKRDVRLGFLSECLGELRSLARTVIEMKYLNGLRISDIADDIDKSQASVEMILVRARRALRACVERKLLTESVP